MGDIQQSDCTIGKLVARGITEISGEAGAGKTQLCLTLALQVSVAELLLFVAFIAFTVTFTYLR